MTRYGLILLIVPVILSAGFGILTAYNGATIWKLLLLFSLAYLIFTMYFIRDPKRGVPQSDSIIVSAADGTVIEIVDDTVPGIDGQFTRVSIFMSVFNVHVNRIPYAGTVKDIRYNPGKFHVASVPKASELNEQTLIVIDTPKGTYAFKQIAGLIARRIVTRLDKGQNVKTGAIFGMIRFGSRVDMFLPKAVVIKVKNGQKVTAGETVIGEWGVK